MEVKMCIRDRYTDFLSSQNHQDRVKFIRCSEWLIENQKNDGSIEIDSAIKSNDKNENDSISVKTLGEMLSVFARAYKLTGEEKDVYKRQSLA